MNNNPFIMQQILSNMQQQEQKGQLQQSSIKDTLSNKLNETQLAYYPNPYSFVGYNPNLQDNVTYRNYKDTLRANPQYRVMFWSRPENIDKLNEFTKYQRMYNEADEMDPERKLKEFLWEVNPANIYNSVKNSELFYRGK